MNLLLSRCWLAVVCVEQFIQPILGIEYSLIYKEVVRELKQQNGTEALKKI